MRLDVGLMHRLCRVAPLDDHLGFAEPRLHVTVGETNHLGDVRRLGRFGIDPRGEDVVVQYRRIVRHRRLDIHDMRQYLVLNLDQVERLFGDRRRDRRDRGDRVSFVERLSLGHAVARQVPQIMRHRPDGALAWRDVREVGACRHRLDAGQRHRLVGVDRDDAGMGVGAALDLAPQHAGHFHVGAKVGPAGNLVDAVGTDRPGADNFQRLLVEVCHRAASARMTAAASSTARMLAVGLRLWSSNALAATINPGVQKPHCSAACSRNFCCTGCSLSP